MNIATRHTGVKVLIAAIFALSLFGSMAPGRATPAQAAANPIVTENQQPGSSGWVHGDGALATDGPGQIKGYASTTSVSQNSSITFYVSVSPAQTYVMDFYRIGWYAGSGGRFRLHVAQALSGTQAPCPMDPSTGLRACNWQPSYTLTVPTDWTSGIYVVLMTNAQGWQNYILFVVKDGRPAALLYQQSVAMYQAFNNYPDDRVTGKSLYDYNSYGANTVVGSPRAVKVSYDRPYANGGDGQFWWYEVQMVRWLERNGYDVTYSTDVDTHANGAELKNHKAFLSVGNNDYWSKDMWDAAAAARDAGVGLAFFTSGAAAMQIRFEASGAGVANRVEVCYRDARLDPVQGPTTTGDRRLPPLNTPEQTLEGVQYTSSVAYSSTVPYVVSNSSHWAYAGTGLKDGDQINGFVGPNMDRYMSNYPSPAATSRTLLAQSPFTNSAGAADTHNTSIYQAPSGAWVFGAGTPKWSWALDHVAWEADVTDARIQRLTANVLDAFVNGAPVASSLQVSAPASVPAGQAFSVTVTAVNSRGNVVPTYSGTVHFSSSDTAAGVVLPADSKLVNGQGTFSVKLATQGSQTLTVSDAANAFSTAVTITVTAGASVSSLKVVAPSTATAGQGFTVTVTAVDSLGNTVTQYAGTVHFSSSDTASGVVLPPDSRLTNGQGTFSVTLVRAGAQTLTVSDAANSLSTTANVSVTAALANHLGLATTAAPTAGTSFAFNVTALDPYGNTDPTYAGRVHFTSSDTSAAASLPPDSGLTSGQATFNATLVRAGAQTITGTDTVNATIAGTVTIQVTAAAAASLSLATPASARPSQAFPVTVRLFDRFGNMATGYRGTVHFSTSDSTAQSLGGIPGDYTFTGNDGGTRIFWVTLVTPTYQSITVRDTANASLSATNAVNVSAF
jgi:hypothetical protein